MAVFLLAALGISYVLVGYPLLLVVLVRLFERPVLRNAEHLDTVTVLIAVRNGERWLQRKIESVLDLDYPQELRDVIIISDGSTDATDQIAQRYADRRVRLLRVQPGGKPAALNQAVPLATGNLLFLTDVRQILKPDCLCRLVSAMADPDVGVVSGDLRIAQGQKDEEQSTGLYWRYENWIRSNLARLDSMLGATGPVNLIRRSLFTPIPPDSLLDDVYLPMSIHLKGYRLVLEPGAIALDEPTDLSTEFRRKVRTQAGMIQFIGTFPGLFSSRNRMKFHFLSLKVGRLLLPHLLMALFVSAFFLPEPWNWWAVAPQLLFWTLALADPWFAPGSTLKKVSALPRAFAVLVSSALLGLKILFVPPRKLWVEARTK